MNDVVPFNFENISVRVVMISGVPWWVASDVCRVLEITEGHRATSRLDDEDKGRHTVTTPGGRQDLTTINESGLYSLILTSRKEAAKRFKRWVTSEVLPSIRQNGGYIAGQETLSPEEIIAKALVVANKVIEQKQARIDVLEPIAAVAEEPQPSPCPLRTRRSALQPPSGASR